MILAEIASSPTLQIGMLELLYRHCTALEAHVLVAVSRKWSQSDTVLTTAKPEARTGHSVIHSSMARCLYVYGGSKNKKWFSDVYMVDTDNWTWQCIRVSVNNIALC